MVIVDIPFEEWFLESDGCRLFPRRDRIRLCYIPPQNFLTLATYLCRTGRQTPNFDTFSPVKDPLAPFYVPDC
jgi:hypothetical protein